LCKFIPAMILFCLQSIFYKIKIKLKRFSGVNNIKIFAQFLDFSEFDNIVFSIRHKNIFVNVPFTLHLTYTREEIENMIRLSDINFLP